MDLRAGNKGRNFLPDIRDSEVLRIAADVEDFPCNGGDFRGQHTVNGACNIMHMDEWSPLVAAVHFQATTRECFGDECVYHEVEPQPMRRAEDGSES